MGIFFTKHDGCILRSTWDAIDPLVVIPLHHPVPDVYITSVESQTYLKRIQYHHDCMRFLRDLQKKEMFDEGLSDIAYNFYISEEAIVYEGRGWYGAPTLKGLSHDPDALAIAYICSIPGSRPTEKMLSKVKDLIQEGVKNEYIDEKYIIEPSSET